jgi:hypothetical protein
MDGTPVRLEIIREGGRGCRPALEIHGDLFDLPGQKTFGYRDGVAGTSQFGAVSNARNSGLLAPLGAKARF